MSDLCTFNLLDLRKESFLTFWKLVEFISTRSDTDTFENMCATR